MGRITFQVINACDRCTGKRLCTELRNEVREAVDRMNRLSLFLDEALPDAVVTVDCSSFDGKYRRGE